MFRGFREMKSGDQPEVPQRRRRRRRVILTALAVLIIGWLLFEFRLLELLR
jgi:hypothetical protein